MCDSGTECYFSVWEAYKQCGVITAGATGAPGSTGGTGATGPMTYDEDTDEPTERAARCDGPIGESNYYYY